MRRFRDSKIFPVFHRAKRAKRDLDTFCVAQRFACTAPEGFVEERTAVYNRTRGLFAESGVVLPQSPERLEERLRLTWMHYGDGQRCCIGDLLAHTDRIEDGLVGYERAISEIARHDECSWRLMLLRGIGPTSASALVARPRPADDFRNGRQVEA